MTSEENDDGTTPAVELPREVFKARVPFDLACSDISGTAVKVYCALYERGTKPSNCYPSVEFIAGRVHASDRTVKRALKELTEAGWVTVTRRYTSHGHRTSNGYRLHERPVRGSDTNGTKGAEPTNDGSDTNGTQEPKCQKESGLSDKNGQPKVTPVAQELLPTNSNPDNQRETKPVATADETAEAFCRFFFDHLQPVRSFGEIRESSGWERDWLAAATSLIGRFTKQELAELVAYTFGGRCYIGESVDCPLSFLKAFDRIKRDHEAKAALDNRTRNAPATIRDQHSTPEAKALALTLAGLPDGSEQ